METERAQRLTHPYAIAAEEVLHPSIKVKKAIYLLPTGECAHSLLGKSQIDSSDHLTAT